MTARARCEKWYLLANAAVLQRELRWTRMPRFSGKQKKACALRELLRCCTSWRVFGRYLQQKRASKRGEQVEGDSDDSVEARSLGLQGEAAGGQQEARAASPPTVVTTTTTLSKSGQTNKCVGMPLSLLARILAY
jgi:hypothetical protein